MLLVRPETLGAAGYGLALRRGMLRELLPGVALPGDVTSEAGLRSLAVAPLLPRRAVVTGLAGLWIHTGTSPTATIDVVGPRAMHRPDPVPGAAMRIHTHVGRVGPAHQIAGMLVASVARCCADALRFSPSTHAFGAVHRAAREGLVDVEGLEDLVLESPAAHRGEALTTLSALSATMSRAARGPHPGREPGLREAA